MPYHLITGQTAKLSEERPKAKGRPRQQPGRMNKTEAAYAWELNVRLKAGEVLWWAFEPVKLRLAGNTSYTPDFLVMLADGTLEFAETKGHWEDDSRVKIKVAAETFWMFRFRAVQVKAGKIVKEETWN